MRHVNLQGGNGRPVVSDGAWLLLTSETDSFASFMGETLDEYTFTQYRRALRAYAMKNPAWALGMESVVAAGEAARGDGKGQTLDESYDNVAEFVTTFTNWWTSHMPEDIVEKQTEVIDRWLNRHQGDTSRIARMLRYVRAIAKGENPSVI